MGGIIGSGLVNAPPIIWDTTSVGPLDHVPSEPLTTTHIVVSLLPISGGPTPFAMVHSIPTFMHGGTRPSTTIHTISVTTSIVESHQFQPPFTHGTYMPASPSTIVAPSRTSPGPSLSFMASLNLPDLAQFNE